MENCFTGVAVPTPIPSPCNGEFISTDCVTTPNAIAALDIVAGNNQTQINAAITNALVFKEEQITTITGDIQPFVDRKIYRGSFLGSVLSTPVEDTITNVTMTNPSAGIYTVSSTLFKDSTSVIITPNGGATYDDITITYDYTNILTGVIGFKVKNNGVLVNLLKSPIKIEI